MRKTHFFGLIVLIILLLVGIPLIVDWVIIANTVPSNISNSDWVGFFGNYVGAIMGGAVSLIGIGVTIRFTKQQIALSQEQFLEQNKLNNRPMLDFEISNIVKEADDETIIMNCKYALKEKENVSKAIIVFDICNIGLGAALDIKYGIEVKGELQDGIFKHWKTSFLKSGCKAQQKIMIAFPRKKEYTINLVIFYDDILGNRYMKRVTLQKQPIETGGQTLMILGQEKGDVCDILINDNYYIISSLQPTDACR